MTTECQHEDTVVLDTPEGLIRKCMGCEQAWLETPKQQRKTKWAHYRKAKKPSRKRG